MATSTVDETAPHERLRHGEIERAELEGLLRRAVVMMGGAAAKGSLIRSHRTQLGAITDDPQGFSIAAHELAVFAHPVEYFVEER